MSISEMGLELREATTRYINITCKSKETGEDFDFTDYTVQTHLHFGPRKEYANSTIINNIVSYKIPASISLGTRSGIAETRIFKDGDVYEVLRINITVFKADQPDTAPLE